MSDENKNPFNLIGNAAEIIKVVTKPLNFLTLALIVAQGILFYLVQRAEGVNYTIFLVGFILLTFLLVILVGIMLLRGEPKQVELTSDEKVTDYKYDVFLSMPMAALSDTDYRAVRQMGLDIMNYVRRECGPDKVKFVGEFIEDRVAFDPNDTAVVDDLDDIKNSRFFVLIYPERIVTSVLVEAGIALALGKVCRYFVKTRRDLPFLMQQSEQAFTNIRIYEYDTIDDIKRVLKDKRCFA